MLTSEPVVKAERPKPKLDDHNSDGSPKFANYEDWCDDLSAWHSDLAVRRAEAVVGAKQTASKQQMQRFWWNRRRDDLDLVAALVLLVGTIFVAAMGMYPPWEATLQRSEDKLHRSAGYHWIFTPPYGRNSDWLVAINLNRLGVQLMTVVLVVGGVVAALKSLPRDAKP